MQYKESEISSESGQATSKQFVNDKLKTRIDYLRDKVIKSVTELYGIINLVKEKIQSKVVKYESTPQFLGLKRGTLFTIQKTKRESFEKNVAANPILGTYNTPFMRENDFPLTNVKTEYYNNFSNFNIESFFTKQAPIDDEFENILNPNSNFLFELYNDLKVENTNSDSEKKFHSNGVSITASQVLPIKDNEIFPSAIINDLSQSLSLMKSVNDLVMTSPFIFDEYMSNASNGESTLRPKKYKMFSAELKRKCVDLAKNTDPKKVSIQCGVPIKSLKRWINVGAERKKGGGRKIKDPTMEKKLYSWYNTFHIEQNNPVTAKMIKRKALEFRTCKDFIASKGWLEKFKKKYKLDITRENKINK